MTKPISFVDDLFIVIVLFQQSLAECASYKSLIKARGHVGEFPALMIYDNSPEALNWKSRPSEVIYVHNLSNPGVSKAYNEAHKVASQLNKKWLLLVDQDTEFPKTIFSDYSNAIQKYPQINVFTPSLFDSRGLISPFQLQWGKGSRITSLNSTIYSFTHFKIINSGMLISTDAFKKAGGYNERFPLDYSDMAFLDRVSNHEPDFVLIASRCPHHFSATKKISDLLADLDRFKSFCEATRLYKKTSIQTVILTWIILPRALKLSFQMKDIRFLRIGIDHIIQTE